MSRPPHARAALTSASGARNTAWRAATFVYSSPRGSQAGARASSSQRKSPLPVREIGLAQERAGIRRRTTAAGTRWAEAALLRRRILDRHQLGNRRPASRDQTEARAASIASTVVT